jgi:pyrroloquinoline quinone biosynthesis protein B
VLLMRAPALLLWAAFAAPSLALAATAAARQPPAPFLVVLGIAQDGGSPQAGQPQEPGWHDPGMRRHATSLAIIDEASGSRWIFDATPDFPAQLNRLDELTLSRKRPGIDGIFLTHAHIGHYTGLMFLGKEVIGAKGVPVYAMPRMRDFLVNNGPWSQLVKLENIALKPLKTGVPVQLATHLQVIPIMVPHRQEFSEVVGFRIEGPGRKVLFIPDIDSWEQWDAAGTRIEDEIARVDVAYLDATFFANGEIPGRDMSGFPHPFIRHSIARFAKLPAKEKAKVRFIHLNHTNKALWPGTAERGELEAAGFRVAEEGERIDLSKP